MGRSMKLSGARASDVILATLVVAITAMLVIPVPTALLDVLLVVNLSFSLLLLLVGLYMPNSLTLLAFPSLLLITTLFRLALNVASARLILSQGYAGEVINAFGSFLIRGEIVVGAIIFTIVTIVNFIVIARGSSRVSEVAARFALDALPGKQMMIDSDVRAGLITAEQARSRREELQRESMLYGSMDGAMKFVQGDAIAGFFVILANILGGMYLGIRNGLSFSEAIETYTILTVGDGLVSQIPALLISVCAGLVVTRVSSSEDSTLGSDLSKQLFARPGAMLMAGIILILFGILPGLPFVPFALVGTAFIGGSAWLSRNRSGGAIADSDALEVLSAPSTLLLLGGSPEEIRRTDESPLIVALDSLTLFRSYEANEARYRSWWRQFQSDMTAQTGLFLPDLHVIGINDVAPASWQVHFRGSVVTSGTVPLDCMLADVNPSNAEILGVDVVREIVHPVSRGKVFWTPQTSSARKILDAGGIRSFDFMEYIGLTIGVFFKQHPEELLSLADVHASLKQLDKRYPGLVADALSVNFLSMPRLTELLQEIIRQGMSVLDFRGIVEAVASWCSMKGVGPQDDVDVDLGEIVSFVRLARRRQIASALLSSRKALRAVVLSDEVEEIFDDMPRKGHGLNIDPEIYKRLHVGLESVMRPIRERGLPSVTLLCRPELRSSVQKFLELADEHADVMTFDELTQDLRVEQIATWDSSKI